MNFVQGPKGCNGRRRNVCIICVIDDAYILAIVEAESRPVLAEMNKFILNEVGGTPYPHIMVIDGNDRRGIDVGIMTKEGFEIGPMQSHVHDLNYAGAEIFIRDCPEYEIT